MDGSSRTRKPSLLQTAWVKDDGVCSAPQKRSADRYREKYRKASRDTLQVMLNWGGVLWNSVPLLTEDAMRYPIVIERGDDTHAYGVVVPDLPGCFSAGDTLDEAYVMAKEAVEGWLECAIDDGEAIPEPSSMESVAKIDEYQGWILGTVDVDLSKLSDKSERVNITLPRRVLHRLDGLATRNGDTRSGYIAHLVLSAS